MKKQEEKELVGVKEIARRANVSIATVDRVLHNRTGVSIKTKQKIEAIISDINYKPNVFARRLATKRAIRLAVLIPAVSQETAYWQAPLDGILKAEKEIVNYGIDVETYFFDQNDNKTFENQASAILSNNYDGVLLAPIFTYESLKFVQKCFQKSIPYVVINSDIPDNNSLCYIGPNLYQSGYMAAHLFNYLLNEKSKILVVNISKRLDNQHHLLQKEKGFRDYFADKKKHYEIVKIDIRQTDYNSVEKSLDKMFKKVVDISAVFVTNSRVSTVAQYLKKKNLNHLKIFGFDYLQQNLSYLKDDVIDFLICQKPKEQGYLGIMALYNKLVHETNPERITFMPIDIISKENYQYYQN